MTSKVIEVLVRVDETDYRMLAVGNPEDADFACAVAEQVGLFLIGGFSNEELWAR